MRMKRVKILKLGSWTRYDKFLSLILYLMPKINKNSTQFIKEKKQNEEIMYGSHPDKMCYKVFKRALWKDDSDLEDYVFFASLLLRMNKFEEAWSRIKYLIKNRYFHSTSHCIYAEIMFRKGNFDKGRAIFEETLVKEQYNREERTLFLYGRLEHDNRNFDRVPQIIKRFQHHDKGLRERKQLQINLHSKLAFQIGKSEKALLLLQHLIDRLNVDSKEVYYQRMVFILKKQGKYIQAEKKAIKAIEFDGTDGEGFYHYARVLFKLQKIEQAVDKMRVAYDLTEEDPVYWFHLSVYEFLLLDKQNQLPRPAQSEKQEEEISLQNFEKIKIKFTAIKQHFEKTKVSRIRDSINHFWYSLDEVDFLKKQVVIFCNALICLACPGKLLDMAYIFDEFFSEFMPSRASVMKKLDQEGNKIITIMELDEDRNKTRF